jgi:hypothetical protein
MLLACPPKHIFLLLPSPPHALTTTSPAALSTKPYMLAAPSPPPMSTTPYMLAAVSQDFDASGDASFANVYMAGQDVFKFAVRSVPTVIEAALSQAGLEKDQVDWLVMHQANQRILDAAATRLGLPAERVGLASTSGADPLYEISEDSKKISFGHFALSLNPWLDLGPCNCQQLNP